MWYKIHSFMPLYYERVCIDELLNQLFDMEASVKVKSSNGIIMKIDPSLVC